MLRPSWLRRCAAGFAPGADLAAPELAPLATDLGGLPPMVVHVGSEEILLPDAVRLARGARAAGVPVELRRWDGLWHVAHASAGMVAGVDDRRPRARRRAWRPGWAEAQLPVFGSAVGWSLRAGGQVAGPAGVGGEHELPARVLQLPEGDDLAAEQRGQRPVGDHPGLAVEGRHPAHVVACGA